MFIDHRYKVIESLGTGSWANVYHVEDVRTGTEYTLKLFKYMASSELYDRFSAEEMHHITKIEHPNLSHVLDFGHVGDHVYFLSEYFEGSTLNNFRYSKHRLDQLFDVIVQICYALHALHTQGILHKDLKLENTIYRVENNQLILKLIDYGFSKMDVQSETQRVSGALPYMAPEIYLGKLEAPSSDFYSLGVMLYRLTTGAFPYSVDQINALITGSHQYFIPIFPSELNNDIPLQLEKFILKLLEKNPDNRFQNSEEIIAYINRIQDKQYPFSIAWSMVNSLKFNSYLVRESISHQLLDYIPSADKGNGKIISLLGGDGMGKDNILSLCKFHLLNGQYFLYDYNCTKTNHEAFFALIKEYLQSLSPEQIQKSSTMNKISKKFERYLFQSEQAAKEVAQSLEDLKLDFESVKELVLEISKRSTVIFIIRNFQFVHQHTIDFINFFSSYLVKNRILLVLSCTDYNKVNKIEHTVLINIPNLNETESSDYVKKLVRLDVPERFCKWIYTRAAGNPFFIQEILIDLITNKKIVKNGIWNWDEDLDNYALPARLVHAIYSKMSHLTQDNYNHLQKLAVAHTPLNRDLIIQLLNLEDHQLYSLLNDALYNEILYKESKHYYYTYLEAKERFVNEVPGAERLELSRKIIRYYDKQVVHDIEICKGIIQNTLIANDYPRQRRYYLRLYSLYEEDYNQDLAYNAILKVVLLDTLPHTKVKFSEMISDLRLFQEKMELTGNIGTCDELLDSLSKIPPVFESYMLMGTIYMLLEDSKEAIAYFEKADLLAITGKQKAQIWLYIAYVLLRFNPDDAKSYLDKIDNYQLPLDLQVLYVNRKAVYLRIKKDINLAIKTIEDFLSIQAPAHDTKVLIRLANLHNDLGVFYSEQRIIDEAEEHLNIALGIWKRYNIVRYFGLIYNNISDIYLKQGVTQTAEHYSELGYKYAKDINSPLNQALARLNQGEAKIKMGRFEEAEIRLLESKELVLSVNSDKFLDSIQRNLALAKSKINNFSYYHSFIETTSPELINGTIKEINPLVKTYFYYLFELFNHNKLKKLISKNPQINYSHLHEEEFYHNVLSLIAILNNDHETALNELKQALHYAGEIKNSYATAVFYIFQAECHYGLGNYEKATELLGMAEPLVRENCYRYWEYKIKILEMKIALMNPELPLREQYRVSERCFNECKSFHYYQLVVDIYQIRIQILTQIDNLPKAQRLFLEYKKYLDTVTMNIPQDDRNNYLNIGQYHLKDINKFSCVKLAPRRKNMRSIWNELLYNITNLSNVDRIRFLIEKGIRQVLAPKQFRLMEYSEKISTYIPFISYNCDINALIEADFNPYIERAMRNDSVEFGSIQNMHFMVAALISGRQKIGYLILTDDSDLEFSKHELSILKAVRQNLTSLIIRIQDYTQITQRIEKMNQLMQISHELMSIVDIEDLEQEIVSKCIDFTNSPRGFLIKRDEEGKFIYKVHLDETKQILQSMAGISKTVLSHCHQSLEPLLTYNAIEDHRFRGSISVQDYYLHTIFCAPIVLDKVLYGFLYLDNMNNNNREMYLNSEIINLLLEQISIALKNARQYEAVISKNKEMHALELLKDEFMAIVSHELNTPLTTLQGYVSRIKRNIFSDEEEKKEIIGKIENQVRKLILTTQDITTMNNYNLISSLPKTPIDIYEILSLVQQEVEILSRHRRMFIKIEAEPSLPNLTANWEAIHRMIYNIALNAIRFTNDFGNVILGARRSAFQQEKIDNKESLILYIQDNGIGIPEQQVGNVFRKFYELNEIYAHKSGSIEYRSSGLGLGLSTAKRIVELHKGNIWIKSKENEGTTVFVALPFKP